MKFSPNKKRILIWVFVIVGILVGFSQVPYLRYLDDAESYSFIPADELDALQKTEAKFESGTAQSIIILENKDQWTTFEHLSFLAQLSDTIRHFSEYTNTSAITSIQLMEKHPFGIEWPYLVDLNSRSGFEKWEKRKDRFTDISSKFISENDRYALIYYDRESIPAEVKTTIQSLQGYFGLGAVYFFETNRFNAELQSNANLNLIVTGLISLLLIGFCFFLLTRSFRGFVLTLLLITFNLAVVILVMALFNISVGPHVSAVPSIIAVMSFSDIMHIIYVHQKLSKTAPSDRDLRKKIVEAIIHPSPFHLIHQYDWFYYLPHCFQQYLPVRIRLHFTEWRGDCLSQRQIFGCSFNQPNHHLYRHRASGKKSKLITTGYLKKLKQRKALCLQDLYYSFVVLYF